MSFIEKVQTWQRMRQQIMKLHLKGNRQVEIAEKTGKSRQFVNKVIRQSDAEHAKKV